MGFWAFLKLLWTYLPEFLAMAKTISRWVQSGLNEIEIRRKLALFDQAIARAEETHDTSELEDLFRNPKPKP